MTIPSKVQFAPFIAINQFMVPEYRYAVIETVYRNILTLSTGRRSGINSLTQRYVKIPGFRNSDLAPSTIKIRHAQSAFEHHSQFVAQILDGWSAINEVLRKQVYDLLKERGWEILPVETDRTKLPGFLTRWPVEETYQVLGSAFTEKYPEIEINENDLRLMAVWLSGRLPFDMEEMEGAT